MSEFKKPVRDRQYVKSNEELAKTLPEIEHAEKIEAAHASEDYSGKSDPEITDAEFLKRLRISSASNLLPDAPTIPGYHLCWIPLTSNNNFDTVHFRKQIGYSMVKPEEIPDFMLLSNRAGQVDGCVSYNEMILMKIPVRLYNLLMKDAHHTQPIEQERVIKQTITSMEDKEGANIARDLHEMSGINKLARKVPEPTFIN